jgi:NitT/TauT family transport system substrate-binding protein
MNEINALIWPSPTGIGLLDKGTWAQTISVATKYGILKNEPSDGAFRTDLAKKALDLLGDKVDTRGASFKKSVVELKEGGN